eukprot:Blabericola_migrator_1__1388@NODE_1360_length_4722_cov_156_189903_g913_i0_p1_GENE_NODE_1360_length_4722_cov_156_189903_g913_i0NODE_1360_length_4722_cov_156_189903_g913_i0_p1_ORF_typecomplete_len954_score197_33SNase/PF00565_17/6_4e15SNase/PF00565_17/9_3e18SNase/PF00565_17/5_4e18SNase/PF00565_17/1_2e10SNase/PF00565_17/2_4e07TUDOR/PF00567_24/9_2e03TUDOR/PF00567_24/5_1e25SMN/PF06003_12/2_4e07LBR_tudor/PF09465_10/0_00058Tudor_3/PF18115_1/0_002tRNA_anti_2/PF13742_6/0_28_NODE_1360_length_4722_cov_156_1
MAASSRIAVVKYVPSGNQLVLLPQGRGTDKEGCYNIGGIRAPRMAMKSATHEEPDESFAYESREFLRVKVIGKTIKYTKIGSHNGRDYITATFEGQDLAGLMLSEGLAKVEPSVHFPQPANMADLALVEKLARDQKLGIWSDEPAAPRAIKYAVGDVAYAKAFADKVQGQEIQGIIEYFRDADTMRIYFPEHCVLAQCRLTGVSCPQTRRPGSNDPEPFAEEAKAFVELRLWGRSLRIRIDGCDQYANVYVSPIHPKGSIIELLISNGYARIEEQSAKHHPDQNKLRELLKTAQAQRLKRWHAFEAQAAPKVSALAAPTGASPTAKPESFQARIIEIFNGDSFSAVPLDKLSSVSQPAPIEIMENELRLYVASIRCPRGRTRVREAEPYSFEALECAKELVAGKKVTITIDYIRTPTPSTTGVEPPPASDSLGRLYFCTVRAGDTTLNMELVKKGLAKVQRHRVEEDRAAQYDDLLIAEKEAQESKTGMYSTREAPKHRINDLCGPTNVQKARAMEASLRREGKFRVQVDGVINGARYRCTAYEIGTQFTMILSGVRAPVPARVQASGQSTSGDPMAQESIAWARYHLLHRKMMVEINACDRGGAFIGQMWRTDSVGKESINAKIVQAGLARLDDVALRLSPISSELMQAEEVAVKKRMGMYALPEAVSEWEAKHAPSPASVSTETGSIERNPTSMTDLYMCYIDHDGHVYCQLKDDDAQLQEVQALANKLGDAREDAFQDRFTAQKPPRKGDLVLCRFTGDNQWYRARIMSVEPPAKAQVAYIDYGNREKVSFDRLLRCPPELNSIVYTPMAIAFSLSGVKVLKDQEAKAKQLLEELSDTLLTAVVLGPKDPETSALPAVLQMPGGSSLNQELVAAGFARVSTTDKLPPSERSALLTKERQAKSDRLGIWFYGDVGNSDDELDDDDMPVLRR